MDYSLMKANFFLFTLQFVELKNYLLSLHLEQFCCHSETLEVIQAVFGLVL